jgi:hypothetical protein
MRFRCRRLQVAVEVLAEVVLGALPRQALLERPQVELLLPQAVVGAAVNSEVTSG